MTVSTDSPIGFIGVGRMGHGMLKNLLAAGASVHVYDLDPSALAAAAALGATPHADPAAVAARVKTLFLCVPAGPEVRAVLFGDHANPATAVVASATNGLLIVDHTTYNRDEAEGVAARAREHAMRYADCPISGMPQRADNGTLTIMFGGAADDFADAQAYLNVTGEFVVHCGEVGTGQLMKAFNNVIYDINIAAFCELLPLALRAGLDQDVLAKVVTSGSSRSFASEYFVPRILAGEFRDDFSLSAAYKDIQNVQETATRLHAMTPLTSAMVAVYQQAIAQGYGDEPKSSMIKVYEQQLGIEFRHDG
jgi:3-hydroxyisobutyrate dehydrogenase-like beta-hydroxyacid dehydrogenase